MSTNKYSQFDISNTPPRMIWPDPYEQQYKLERYITAALLVMHPEDKPKLLRLLVTYATTLAEGLEALNERIGVPDRDVAMPDGSRRMDQIIQDDLVSPEPDQATRDRIIDAMTAGDWKLYLDREVVCGPKPIANGAGHVWYETDFGPVKVHPRRERIPEPGGGDKQRNIQDSIDRQAMRTGRDPDPPHIASQPGYGVGAPSTEFEFAEWLADRYP